MNPMRFLRFSLFSTLLALLCGTTGCMSTSLRLFWNDRKLGEPGEVKPLYVGAVYDVKIFVNTYTGNEKLVLSSFLLFLSLPFDVVLDTVLLPYDIYSNVSDKSDQWFWERVFEENDTTLSVEEYRDRLTMVGKKRADKLLREDENGFSIIHRREKNAEGKIVRIEERKVVPQGRISPQMRELYQQVVQLKRREHAEKMIEYFLKEGDCPKSVEYWEAVRDGKEKELLAKRDAEEKTRAPKWHTPAQKK
jgi:uncharacterized protein YceK